MEMSLLSQIHVETRKQLDTSPEPRLAGSIRLTFLSLNATDCPMHELDSLVICALMNLKLFFFFF